MKQSNLIKSIFVVLILFSFCLVSCDTIRRNIAGKYIYGLRSPFPAQMYLKSDSTFIFTSGFDIYPIKVKGKWQISGKNLILNSYIQSMNDYINVKESYDSTSHGFAFKILDKNGQPFFANLVLNPDEPNPIKFDQNDYFFYKPFDKSQNISSFIVAYLGVNAPTIHYSIKDPKANSFIITLKINPGNGYRFFVNEKWRIRKNKLYENTHTSSMRKRKFVYKKMKG